MGRKRGGGYEGGGTGGQGEDGLHGPTNRQNWKTQEGFTGALGSPGGSQATGHKTWREGKGRRRGQDGDN